jgi:hypothetical protein
MNITFAGINNQAFNFGPLPLLLLFNRKSSTCLPAGRSTIENYNVHPSR